MHFPPSPFDGFCPRLVSAAIKIVKKIRDVTSLLDSTTSFEMSLSHDNIPVRWMFKGVELKSSDKCKILSERKAHKLILQKVDSSDAGEYTAVVGHLRCSAVLTVEGTYHCPLHLRNGQVQIKVLTKKDEWI